MRRLSPLPWSASDCFVPRRAPLAAQGAPADLLIRNGRVIDGTGAPARNADVAITGDRITFVGDAGTRERHSANGRSTPAG